MVRKKVKLSENKSFSSEKESIAKEIQEIRSQLEEISQRSKKKKKHVKIQKKKPSKPKKPLEKKSKEKPTKAKKTIERKKPPEKKKAVAKKVVTEVEEEFDEEEIANLQIDKMDMEKLTERVCNIIGKYGDEGVFQSELWKKLKLTSRDGSRLAVKLEKMGIVKREKVLEDGRWTYKLKIKRVPVSTQSLEDAPCLICPVEQKCSLDGEISPRTCQWIEEWVTIKFAKSKSERKRK